MPRRPDTRVRRTVRRVRPSGAGIRHGDGPVTVPGVVEHFAVNGGARLSRSVDVVGAKNSVLKLMAAALLAEGRTTLENCPEILDVPLMADVLRSLGCAVSIEGRPCTSTCPPNRARRPTTGRCRSCARRCASSGPWWRAAGGRSSRSPGDAIGSRPLDMHQNGLRKLGATTDIVHGSVTATAGDLHGAQIWLDFPSVGATENILMAAVLAEAPR